MDICPAQTGFQQSKFLFLAKTVLLIIGNSQFSLIYKTAHPRAVVLRDVCLPDGNGIELIDRMKNISPSAEIILLTAHGKIEDSVSAIKSSAFDYLVKGDDNNRIFSLIAKEMEKASEAFIVDITTEKQSHLKK